MEVANQAINSGTHIWPTTVVGGPTVKINGFDGNPDACHFANVPVQHRQPLCADHQQMLRRSDHDHELDGAPIAGTLTITSMISNSDPLAANSVQSPMNVQIQRTTSTIPIHVAGYSVTTAESGKQWKSADGGPVRFCGSIRAAVAESCFFGASAWKKPPPWWASRRTPFCATGGWRAFGCSARLTAKARMPDSERERRVEELHSGAPGLGTGERDSCARPAPATRNCATPSNRCWATNKSCKVFWQRRRSMKSAAAFPGTPTL